MTKVKCPWCDQVIKDGDRHGVPLDDKPAEDGFVRIRCHVKMIVTYPSKVWRLESLPPTQEI